MIGLYHPADSPLHRAPVGLKLAVLLGAMVVLFGVGGPVVVTVALVVTVVAYAVAKIPWRLGLAQLRPVLWVIGVAAGFHLFTSGPQHAAVVAGQLLVAVALAALLTLTTRVSAMLRVFETAARPFRPLGVDPARVALLLALTIRCVPLLINILGTVREARQARGVGRNPLALVTPAVVRALRTADELGEALAARGVDD